MLEVLMWRILIQRVGDV